jgi:chromosome segregation ATPase
MAFNLEQSSSAEMGNLVARIYKVHLACGGEVDERIEQLVEGQKEKKKLANDERRLDEFEKLKVHIKKLSDDILGKIETNTQNPTPELSTQIQKLLLRLNDPFAKMQQLQRDCDNRTGVWAKIRNPKPEIMEQRRNDIIAIRKHIDNLRELSRGKKSIRGGEIDKKGGTLLDNMQDLSQEKGIPGIDLSEGQRQIDENNKLIDIALADLILQVNQISDKANNFKDELSKQAKLLDGIESDVKKYEAKLGDLNKKMDTALQKVGGPFKMIAMIIAMVICLGLVGALWVFSENYIIKGQT